MKLILASSSSQRLTLLLRFNIKPQIVVDPKIDELIFYKCYHTQPRDYVTELALAKAKNIAVRYKEYVVLSADTAVVLEDKIINKPQDEEEAYSMLKLLAGTEHYVMTGYAILLLKQQYQYIKIVGIESSSVKLKKIKEEEIVNYIKNYKYCHNIAGAIDIVGIGGEFVEKIEGCSYNVIGLPIFRILKDLKYIKYNVLNSAYKPPAAKIS